LYNKLGENILLIDLHIDNPTDSFSQLRELGTRQGYVTNDDILDLFSDNELDVDALDQINVILRDTGIFFVQDESFDNVPHENSVDEEEHESHNRGSKHNDDNLLSSIEPDNLVGLYFREAASCKLLTLDEEVDLARRIEQGLLARQEVSDIRNMSAKRHAELLLLIDDGWTALDHLVTANSRLVISIAKKYTHRGVPFLDLIQEGNIGLMRAAKRYDYKRGYKFSTYATWWIRQAVTRALADQSRTIRLPVHRSDQLSKMFRIQYQLKQKLGRDPNISETAEAMGVTSEKIEEISKDAQYPLSLDMPTSVEGDRVLGDCIEDRESPDPEELATISLLRQHLDQVLELLPPREVQILKLRFGLLNGETHTLREVGLKIGVSRERIRQIETQAIGRLRQPEIQNKLRSYLSQQQT
jgi:RNA polymerase primary sigma factor